MWICWSSSSLYYEDDRTSFPVPQSHGIHTEKVRNIRTCSKGMVQERWVAKGKVSVPGNWKSTKVTLSEVVKTYNMYMTNITQLVTGTGLSVGRVLESSTEINLRPRSVYTNKLNSPPVHLISHGIQVILTIRFLFLSLSVFLCTTFLPAYGRRDYRL